MNRGNLDNLKYISGKIPAEKEMTDISVSVRTNRFVWVK